MSRLLLKVESCISSSSLQSDVTTLFANVDEVVKGFLQELFKDFDVIIPSENGLSNQEEDKAVINHVPCDANNTILSSNLDS